MQLDQLFLNHIDSKKNVSITFKHKYQVYLNNNLKLYLKLKELQTVRWLMLIALIRFLHWLHFMASKLWTVHLL